MTPELGPVTGIGPECFASADESLICWKGVNYYREPDDDELARVFAVLDGEMPTAGSGRCTCPVRSDAIGPHTRGCALHPEYGR